MHCVKKKPKAERDKSIPPRSVSAFEFPLPPRSLSRSRSHSLTRHTRFTKTMSTHRHTHTPGHVPTVPKHTMTLLRMLAVLGMSLSAQAETGSTMPKGTQHDPCAVLNCAADSFCNIDATGVAICEKIQTTNHTQDACAALMCDIEHRPLLQHRRLPLCSDGLMDLR